MPDAQRLNHVHDGGSMIGPVAIMVQRPVDSERRRTIRRRWRIAFLVSVIVLLSLADLFVTMTLLNSVGMAEANPLAAFIMRSGNPFSLILYKLGSVSLSVGIILLIRDRWQGEFAAWIAVVILMALAWHWNVYHTQLEKLDNSFPIFEAQKHADWQTWMRPGGD